MLFRQEFLMVLAVTSIAAVPVEPGWAAGWEVGLETGSAAVGYNDVQIPNKTGTAFSLTEDLEPQSAFFYRLRLNIKISDRHFLHFLVAPLKFTARGRTGKDISFENVTFPASTPLEAGYRFNSYRFSYRYSILNKPRTKFNLGLTAKIRDAEISLTSPSQRSVKANTGFVPLLSFYFAILLSKKSTILVDGDALAAPQGRAEDILIACSYQLNNRMQVSAGYRLLEGGADVDEVYNFALIHYITAGILLRL